MADVEYFIDPPDFLLGTLAEWKRYLAALEKVKNPGLSVRSSIEEAQERIAALS